MVDYGPGDEIVCVFELEGDSHKLNSFYTCVDIRPALDIDGLSPAELKKCCVSCGKIGAEIVAVMTCRNYKAALWSCACRFRKKLDFKKLCNVDETIKIKEDA